MAESINDLRKTKDENSSSKTYVEFQSDGSEAQRQAYRLVSRGGRMRQSFGDVDELYAVLTTKLAPYLFEDDPVPLMEYLDLEESDWETYLESRDED